MPLTQLLAGDVVTACAGLIGCVLARRLDDGRLLEVQLVELEAYHQREPGCHAFRGRTPRTAVMFGPPGQLYVYFTYGMWHCANIVCEAEATAAAVLIRAAALYGAEAEETEAPYPRMSGPGLFCRELGLDRSHSGQSLILFEPSRSAARQQDSGAVYLYRPPGLEPPPLSWTTRVGFSFQDTLPWRCYWTGHPAVGKVSLKPLLSKAKHEASKAKQP